MAYSRWEKESEMTGKKEKKKKKKVKSDDIFCGTNILVQNRKEDTYVAHWMSHRFKSEE